MRIKLALVTGAAVLLTAGTGAVAYAVVGHETVSPTITGNDLPIDDNHSPTVTARTTEPGDDRSTGVDDGARHGGTTTTAPATPDDHGGSGGSGGSGGDDGGGHGGHGGDDGSGHH